jgi:hypothetical protein
MTDLAVPTTVGNGPMLGEMRPTQGVRLGVTLDPSRRKVILTTADLSSSRNPAPVSLPRNSGQNEQLLSSGCGPRAAHRMAAGPVSATGRIWFARSPGTAQGRRHRFVYLWSLFRQTVSPACCPLDVPSLSSVSDQAVEAQFREVLRRSRGCTPGHHLGQLIDCVFAAEETPQ